MVKARCSLGSPPFAVPTLSSSKPASSMAITIFISSIAR